MIKKFAPGMWWDTETGEIKYSSVCEAIENSNLLKENLELKELNVCGICLKVFFISVAFLKGDVA